MSFADKLKESLAKIGRAAGLGPLAKLAVAGEKATLDKIEAVARKAGIGEAQIRKARKLKGDLDRKSFLIALLYPIVPNPELIRAIADDPAPDPSPKARPPARPAGKRTARSTEYRRLRGQR